MPESGKLKSASMSGGRSSLRAVLLPHWLVGRMEFILVHQMAHAQLAMHYFLQVIAEFKSSRKKRSFTMHTLD